jgi:major vault protein
MTSRILRLTPNEYVHVLDSNTNITRVEIGPLTFTRKDHEEVTHGPDKLITIPTNHYCVVWSPVLRETAEDGSQKLVYDKHGQVKLRHAVSEVRLSQDPFPLFPGEMLSGDVTPLEVVAPNEALRLLATADFEEELESGEVLSRKAGDEWLFEGPGTFMPRVEVKRTEKIAATILMPNQALRLQAKRQFTDRFGVKRQSGGVWLVRETQLKEEPKGAKSGAAHRKKGGAYIPGVEEEVLEVVSAFLLTDKAALHLRAKLTFNDMYGMQRKAGQEWLVTAQLANSHIPDVCEELVGQVDVTTLTNRQFCVVQDPIDSAGRPALGTQEVRTNTSFFLHPGETLIGGVQPVHVLAEEEALLLSACEAFAEEDGTSHKAGARWMLHGPCDYIPPIQVNIVEKRRVIPLDKNEGIYVRDTRTGTVRSVIGESYMLKPSEVLWEKKMPSVVDQLLNRVGTDLTRVITYPVPHNSACQIYNYKTRVARVVFGPELAMLMPDEQFTVLSLSGGKPKKGHQIKAVRLALGPDFSTDIITVETLDHARLELQLSYNWQFEVDKSSQESAAKLFAVPDFVGDICKLIGSRVRSAVAATTFDDFHRESARIIRSSVFGLDEAGKVRPNLRIETNNITIYNIDR